MTQEIITTVVVGLIGLLFLWAYLRDKKGETERSEKLAQLAESWGYSFQPKGDPALLGALDGFREFKSNNTPIMTQLLRGTSGDFQVAVFDYTTYHNGTQKRSYPRSAVCIGHQRGNLPEFYVVPRQYRDEMWFARKWKKIDVSGRGEFAKKYVLYAMDEMAVTHLFTNEMCDKIAMQHLGYIEGRGGLLLFKRHGIPDVQDIHPSVQWSLEMASLFFRHS